MKAAYEKGAGAGESKVGMPDTEYNNIFQSQIDINQVTEEQVQEKRKMIIKKLCRYYPDGGDNSDLGKTE